MRRIPVRSILLCLLTVGAAAAFAVPAAAAPGAPTITEDNAHAVGMELRGKLGAAFGNAWLDGSKLVVGITDAGKADVVRAAGATPHVVAHSAAHLDSIKARLDRRSTRLPDTVAGWYVDHASNAVVISVVGSDPAAHAFAATAAAGESAVRVEQVAEAPRPTWNIIGGQAIYFSRGRCSAGFNARNASGTRYVITAGHCTNLGGTVSGVGGTIGPVAGSSFPGNDYGWIRVNTSSAVSTARVDRYNVGSDVTVAGSSIVGVGGRVCRSGSTTGWRCGSVQAFNQTVNYGGGRIVYGLTRTNVCAEPGDSGGSFVSYPNSSSRVQAQGLTSGGSGNCTFGGTTFFQPVNEVLSAYGLTLYTG